MRQLSAWSSLISVFFLQIVDGKLWFQLDCGSGPGILGISGRAVNDGSWHSVSLELNRNFTSLSLDDSYVERRKAPLYFQTLSTDSSVYFGAQVQVDNVRSLTDKRTTQVLSGFQGCLDSVVLNNNELPLQNKRSSFAEVVGLTELKLGCVLYPDACERHPCQNGGTCTAVPSGGKCFHYFMGFSLPIFLCNLLPEMVLCSNMLEKSHELYKTLIGIANWVKAVCSINNSEMVPLLIALVFQEEIDLLAVSIILFL